MMPQNHDKSQIVCGVQITRSTKMPAKDYYGKKLRCTITVGLCVFPKFFVFVIFICPSQGAGVLRATAGAGSIPVFCRLKRWPLCIGLRRTTWGRQPATHPNRHAGQLLPSPKAYSSALHRCVECNERAARGRFVSHIRLSISSPPNGEVGGCFLSFFLFNLETLETSGERILLVWRFTPSRKIVILAMPHATVFR